MGVAAERMTEPRVLDEPRRLEDRRRPRRAREVRDHDLRTADLAQKLAPYLLRGLAVGLRLGLW
jgi:hypothetical protein